MKEKRTHEGKKEKLVRGDIRLGEGRREKQWREREGGKS